MDNTSDRPSKEQIHPVSRSETGKENDGQASGIGREEPYVTERNYSMREITKQRSR